MKKLKRIRLEKALNESFGAWKNKEHPRDQEGDKCLCPEPQEKQPPFTRKMKTLLPDFLRGEGELSSLWRLSYGSCVENPVLFENLNKQV
ncbi:MAG: hypothetical protein HZB62_05245 [Nitrospirae bacterium]|nr:hypothetical protein [Nitrospirota bacterium]